MIRVFSILVLCTVFSWLSGCFPDSTIKLDSEQHFVGNRDNSQDSGAWWGENITKIATLFLLNDKV